MLNKIVYFSKCFNKFVIRICLEVYLIISMILADEMGFELRESKDDIIIILKHIMYNNPDEE